MRTSQSTAKHPATAILNDHTLCEFDDGRYELVSYDDFICDNGGVINPLVLVYETFGHLNAKKDNAIIVHHALSTHSHLTSTDKNPEKGWWQDMVGRGKTLDTDQYFIICINNLGSCFGSSGPASSNPQTSQLYGLDFPAITIADMVRSQKRLIDGLGITKLHVVLGSSMGAMLSITWLALYPDHASFLISISSCAQSYPANKANRMIQKEIIRLDPFWNNGCYTSSQSLTGFKTARKQGLLTYRNWVELNDRFLNREGNDTIEHYLDYNAEKFIQHFDCNSYLYLLGAMDNFDLSRGEKTLVDLFRPIDAKVLVVSVDSDILFTQSQQLALNSELSQAGVDVKFIEHHSSFGHDAFLVETQAFGQYIGDFIHG
jgi:homoserine O-acetyltransferase/O-succinyltransferase